MATGATAATRNLVDLEEAANVEVKPRRGATAKSAKVVLAGDWVCPTCPNGSFRTGLTPYWKQRKCAHIKAWHPEQRAELSCRKPPLTVRATAEGEVATWKCPLCDHGMVDSPGGTAGVWARNKHRLEKHPKAHPRLFHLDKKVINAESVRSAQFQRRLGTMNKRILLGKDTMHDWRPLRWPFGNRRGRTDVACRACGRIARGLKQLEKAKCTTIRPGELGWGRRKAFIAMAENEVRKATECLEKAEMDGVCTAADITRKRQHLQGCKDLLELVRVPADVQTARELLPKHGDAFQGIQTMLVVNHV